MFSHGPPNNPGRPSNPGPPEVTGPPEDLGPPDEPGGPTFCIAPPSGLVSWWPLDETSGTTAADIEGANPGTHMNGPVPVTGNVAGALSFDGTDDFVSAGTIASTVAGTMDAWIRPGGVYSGSQFIMGGLRESGADVTARYLLLARHLQISGCENRWLVLIADGSSVQYACSGQLYNSTNFPAGVWTHIAATYDGTDVTFYKDGQSIATVAQTVSGAGNAEPFSIGRAGAFEREGYYNGAIDEVEIFDRALSATEIQAIFDAGSAGKCKP